MYVPPQFANKERNKLYDLKLRNTCDSYNHITLISEGIRDVIDAGSRNYQGIIDKLCQLELDAKNEKRKGVQTKTQKENEPIAQAIVENAELEGTYFEKIEIFKKKVLTND